MRYPIPKPFVIILLIVNLISATAIIYVGERTDIQTADPNICEEGTEYVTYGFVWLELPIRYFITSFIDDEFKSHVLQGIDEWDRATGVSIFQPSSQSNADLIITREPSLEFDRYTLAYAGFDPFLIQYPDQLHLNFNPTKPFEDLPFSCELLPPDYDGTFDIMSVTVHELGHVLGLDHTTDEFTTMHEYYIGTFQKTVSAGDLAGFNAVY